jgi:hypothetical protein
MRKKDQYAKSEVRILTLADRDTFRIHQIGQGGFHELGQMIG